MPSPLTSVLLLEARLAVSGTNGMNLWQFPIHVLTSLTRKKELT